MEARAFAELAQIDLIVRTLFHEDEVLSYPTLSLVGNKISVERPGSRLKRILDNIPSFFSLKKCSF
jgi:hypothetical protein